MFYKTTEDRSLWMELLKLKNLIVFALFWVVIFPAFIKVQAGEMQYIKKTSPEFANVWSRVFLRPTEKVLTVELVTQGDAVKYGNDFKSDVYIRISNGKKEYMQSFFTGRIIQLNNQNEWYEKYATRHESMVSREQSEIQKFEDGSRLSGIELIYDYKNFQEISLDFNGFSRPPELCSWMAFMRPPLTRVRQEFDFQEPRYYWQKFVIFQKKYFVKQNISPIQNSEEAVEVCNYGTLIGKHFQTEVSNSDVLLLGDGTMIVTGRQFVARINLKDGKMGGASKYLRVVDAIDFSKYFEKINHYNEKNTLKENLQAISTQDFILNYIKFANDLVHDTWF